MIGRRDSRLCLARTYRGCLDAVVIRPGKVVLRRVVHLLVDPPVDDLHELLPARRSVPHNPTDRVEVFEGSRAAVVRVGEQLAVEQLHVVNESPGVIRHADEAEKDETRQRIEERHLLVRPELGFDAADARHVGERLQEGTASWRERTRCLLLHGFLRGLIGVPLRNRCALRDGLAGLAVLPGAAAADLAFTDLALALRDVLGGPGLAPRTARALSGSVQCARAVLHATLAARGDIEPRRSSSCQSCVRRSTHTTCTGRRRCRCRSTSARRGRRSAGTSARCHLLERR
jgi:hypothetical protein